ncbi:ATPase, T2SS/T4P/T4SS family [Roseiflexus castenholzii]|uniref:ATPase, T2SS/T4P/T4SS family n=1 Tax=Roseiflexus castenholzii TaxID=120962 RepID=UPI003C7A7B97
MDRQEELIAEIEYLRTHRRAGVDWTRPMRETLIDLGLNELVAAPWDVWRDLPWYGPIDQWMFPPFPASDVSIAWRHPGPADVDVRERGMLSFVSSNLQIGREWLDWVQAMIALRSHRLGDRTETPLQWVRLDGMLSRTCRFAMTRPPYTPDGPTITLRFPLPTSPTIDDLVAQRILTAPAAQLILTALMNGVTLLIAGVTGSGKTTLAGGILRSIGDKRRIIQIEEACELPPPISGMSIEAIHSGVSFSECVRFALRQSPDLIVVGEVRGAEALVMLQAAATGHPGVATIHAMDARSAVRNLEGFALSESGVNPHYVRQLLTETVSLLVVHIGRHSGQRRVLHIAEPLRMVGAAPGTPIPFNDVYVYNADLDLLEEVGVPANPALRTMGGAGDGRWRP